MAKGMLTNRTDRAGNSIVQPYGDRGMVILRNSFGLMLPAGWTVHYDSTDRGSKPGVLFSDSYFCVDSVFYDTFSKDVLLIGRRGQFSVSRFERALLNIPYQRQGTFEETHPRVEYFSYHVSIEAFSRTVDFDRGLLVTGEFRGEAGSLLNTPIRCTPDRKKLAELLAPKIILCCSPFRAEVMPA